MAELHQSSFKASAIPPPNPQVECISPPHPPVSIFFAIKNEAENIFISDPELIPSGNAWHSHNPSPLHRQLPHLGHLLNFHSMPSIFLAPPGVWLLDPGGFSPFVVAAISLPLTQEGFQGGGHQGATFSTHSNKAIQPEWSTRPATTCTGDFMFSVFVVFLFRMPSLQLRDGGGGGGLMWYIPQCPNLPPPPAAATPLDAGPWLDHHRRMARRAPTRWR